MKLYRLFALQVFILALFIPVIASMPVTAAVNAAGSGYITFDTFTGLPGSSIHVSGGGFAPSETVDIKEGLTLVTTVKADLMGKFPATGITIPANTPQGGFVINALGETSNDAATNSYYIIPYTPTITATAPANTPFTALHTKLSGFAPNESILITLATAQATVIADKNGSVMDASLQIPVAAAATYSLTATGQTTGAIAKTFFYVGGFFPSASPSIFFLLPGQTLAFNGSGFANGEVVNVYQGKDMITTLASFTVDNTGSFKNAGGFQIPFSLAGKSLTFHLVGQTSQASASTGASVGNYFATVTPTTYSLLPGATLNFNGKGFYPSENIAVFRGKDTTVYPITIINSDLTGSFKNGGNIVIPYSDAGLTPLFTFIGTTSKIASTTSTSVGKFFPHAAPSSYFVKPGDPFSFNGTGYVPEESVSVMIDKYQYPIESFKVDAKGSFTNAGAFIMPYWASGHTYIYHLTGNKSQVTTDLTVSVTALQVQVTPSAYNVKPGTAFFVTGTGYVASEKADLFIGSSLIPITATVDKMGTVIFNKVALPFGSTTKTISLTITGETSLASASVIITPASFSPQVNTNFYYILPGQSLQFTGKGFAPNENVTVYTGTTELSKLESIKADSEGSLMPNSFIIPFDAKGGVKLSFNGELSNVLSSLSINIAGFNPALTLSTYFQTPGSTITISGTGFAPNEIVSISGSTAPILAQADSYGSFKGAIVTIPFGLTKSFPITATGQSSKAIVNTSIGLAAFSPNITPNSFYQKQGGKASFTGKGFVSGETIGVTQDGLVVASLTADSFGSFKSDTYTLPFTTSSIFVFTGLKSQIPLTISVGLSGYTPAINLSSYYANGGGKVTITGTGYLPGENIFVSFDKNAVGSTKASILGEFSLPLTIPYLLAGSKTILATGEISGASAKTAFNEASVYTVVTLGTYTGKAGSAVTINGNGFISGETVDVTTSQSNGTVVTSFKAGPSGTIADSSFLIPKEYITGNLTITVKGEESLNPVNIIYYIGN